MVCTSLMAGAAMAMLTACTEIVEVPVPVYTVGEAANAIVLSAGISEGGAGVQTRATRAGAEDKHVPFNAKTQLRLRVDGTWTGHDPESISKTTTAMTAENPSDKIDGTVNDKHSVEFNDSEKLYWDDYGTADPANASTGRTTGLTIYGVAVDGKTTAPAVSDWTSLSWNVGTPSGSPSVLDQSNTTTYWKNQDLLISNNVKEGSADGTYKFDTDPRSKLLEFTHAMTKITVNLTAGEGFEDGKFEHAPKVTLLGFNYIGTVNVVEKTSTPATSSATADSIKMHRDGTTWTKATNATFDALVFPGNTFADATDILRVEADGNVYYVNATKINAANTAADDKFEQGKNYVLNITVNKTSIDVTATIKDWENVEAENESPIINISNCYGETGNGFYKGFNFYRSTSLDGSFMESGNSAEVTYASSSYTMSPSLYWPDHQTHYFFRGIWPLVGSKDGSSQKLGPETSDFVNGKQIKVQNVAYKQGYYPSDLMIGMPRKADGFSDETCKVDAHKVNGVSPQGICATDAASGSTHANEGLIHMNFQYAMSQVIVNLTTSDGADKVTFDEHTKVEITGGLTSSVLYLSDGRTELEDEHTAIVGVYKMNRENSVNTKYHDAIIPQPLADGNGYATVKFRITVGNGSSTDVYETVLGVKDIKTTDGHAITEWESGKKYIYTLHISKTDIVAVATIKDWVEVNASGNIWF